MQRVQTINSANYLSEDIVKYINSETMTLKSLQRLYDQSIDITAQFQDIAETPDVLESLDKLTAEQSRLIRIAASLPARNLEGLFAKAHIWQQEAPDIDCRLTEMYQADALMYSLYLDLRALTTSTP